MNVNLNLNAYLIIDLVVNSNLNVNAKLNLTLNLNSQKSNMQRTCTLTRCALQSTLAAECLLDLVDLTLSLCVIPRRQRRCWFMHGTLVCEAHAWSGTHEDRHLRCGFQRHRGCNLVCALWEFINLVFHRHQVQRQVLVIAIKLPVLASLGQTIPGRHAS